MEPIRLLAVVVREGGAYEKSRMFGWSYMSKLFLFNPDQDYWHFLEHVKSRYQTAQIQSVKALNKNLLEFYWWLGKEIVKKQQELDWGDGVVEQLSKDLKQSFPSKMGFSPQNLWYVRRFYLEYKGLEFLQQLVGEIPWGHNILIMTKIKDPDAREYYLKLARDLSLSRDMLALQIRSEAYEHHILSRKQHNFKDTLAQELAQQADHALKDFYTLDFLGLTKPIIETEMERRMVEKIKDVMLTLGYGFAFMGNQYRIRQHGKDYYIDLLFYHRHLQSLVAMELKVGPFKPEYAGKMNFYLNLLDDFVREPHENPSIGIILCGERDRFEVEYTLRNINKPVGVAEFTLTKVLPKELSDKLPNPKELERQIREELGVKIDDE